MATPGLSQYDRVEDDGSLSRFCPRCREWKNREECFQSTGSGSRRVLCRICYPILQNEKRGKLIKAACNQVIKHLVKGEPTKHIDVPHTSELTSAVVTNLGGTAGLAQMISDAAKAANDADPTSKNALEWSKLLVGMVYRSTEQRESAPDVAQMNEEEINSELMAMVGRLLDGNPNLLEETEPLDDDDS